MPPSFRLFSQLLVAAGIEVAALPAQALEFTANYDLTRPVTAPAPWDADLMPRGVGFALGPARISTAFGNGIGSGAGLSVEAGQQWFGRLTVGRSMEADGYSVAGGYRWRDGQSVSMQVTRGLGSERLGLAVRYDWPRYYVRLGYELRPREGAADMLRFSAGIRF